MSSRQKANLFHSLAQLIHSGTPFPKAIEVLLKSAGGALRGALQKTLEALQNGASAADALAVNPQIFGSLEMGVIKASERAGKLEKAFTQLSEYHKKQAEIRQQIVRKTAYPLFLIHFAVLLSAFPALFLSGDWMQYFLDILKPLGIFWGIIFGVFALAQLWLTLSIRSVPADRLLWQMPVFGKVRRGFSMSRFFAAYEMQLESGTNALTGLESAGKASGSAVIWNAVRKIEPGVAKGEKMGPLLAAQRVFPEETVRTILVGEETGRLDRELPALGESHRDDAIRRLDTISEWIPKAVFLGIAGYIGWKVIIFWKGYFQVINDLSR